MTQFDWSVINFAWVPLLPLIVVGAAAIGVLLAASRLTTRTTTDWDFWPSGC
jgi:hypothetical protein